ncbi:MAG: phytanoyl-CoA dioxygenase family protein [Litorimonas sp.]
MGLSWTPGEAEGRAAAAFDAAREDYERDGVAHVRGVITEDELERLRHSVAAQMAGASTSKSSYDFEAMQRQAFSGEDGLVDVGESERFDLELLRFIVETDPDARPLRDPLPEGRLPSGRFFHDAAGWRFHDGIRDVAFNSRLPRLATHLMGTSRTHFWEDTTFVKAPLTPQRTVFHQDWSYFQIMGEQCCIIWIPLDPVGAENGRMEYIRGSHRWGQTYAPSIFFAQSASPVSPYEKLPDIEGNRSAYDIVSFDCEPGDVIVHHVMTIHGSGGNCSTDRDRRALSFRYCGDDIRYFDKPGAIEQQYTQTSPRNGDRLNTHDYPLVWPEVSWT